MFMLQILFLHAVGELKVILSIMVIKQLTNRPNSQQPAD